MEDENCVFCMIVDGKIPAKKVYDDALMIGVLDINPASKGHMIMIPKKHYNNLYEIPQDEFLQYYSIARAVGYAIMLALAPNNVDILYTKELTKGTVTPHAIIHLLPRYDDDTINHVWQPLKLEESDFAAIGNAIESAIEKVKGVDMPKAPEKPAEEIKKQESPKPIEEKKPGITITKKVVVF